MDGVVEIITGRERRRRWSTTEKLRLVGEMQGIRPVSAAVKFGLAEDIQRAITRLGLPSQAEDRLTKASMLGFPNPRSTESQSACPHDVSVIL